MNNLIIIVGIFTNLLIASECLPRTNNSLFFIYITAMYEVQSITL